MPLLRRSLPAVLATLAVAATPRPAHASPSTAPPATVWRPNRPLLATGAVFLTSGYLPNVGLAAPSVGRIAGVAFLAWITLGGYLVGCGPRPDHPRDPCFGDRGAVQLLVPVAGPLLFVANHPRDATINPHGHVIDDSARAALYVSAGLQAAGFAFIIAGVTLGKREPLGGPSRSDSNKGSPSLTIAPLASAGTIGLALGVQRW